MLSFNFYLFLFALNFSACTKVGPHAKKTVIPAIPTDVMLNGIEMGKTDFGKFYYPHIVFYSYKDVVTEQWATYWTQTGYGFGAFKYENVSTTNANGYIASFGYATWSSNGNIGSKNGEELMDRNLISESNAYAIYIQINSNSNRIVKIDPLYK